MELINAFNAITNYIDGCCSIKSPLQHQHLSGGGAVYKLTEKLSNLYNKKYALTFCNATTALHALCLAMDLNNNEIITSPVNWGGAIAPFLLHGNRLRFTAIEPNTFNLAVNDLQFAITGKSKAILSVDYDGIPANSEAIKEFAVSHGLRYISDSAQSLGAYNNGKPAGYYADAIVLSFSPGKSFFAGEGGAVITDDQLLFERLVWFSQHPSKQKTIFGLSNYNHFAPLNGRMNPLSAILLNETFEIALDKLKNYQGECFELINLLQMEGLIEINESISSPQSSTFFNFSLQLKSTIPIDQLNKALKKKHMTFFASYSSTTLIPFDNTFKSQFQGKFACTKSLKKQGQSFLTKNRATLNYLS
jgi:perosamine synthetase